MKIPRQLAINLILWIACFLRAYGEEPESGWEIAQWENFYELEDGLFGDPDKDGISNYVEFGFGLNPLERQPGEEFSPELSIKVDAGGNIELSLWQPELQNEFLGWENAYGRQWFSIAVQSTESGDQWETIADKIGVSPFWGLKNIEVISEKQRNGRFEVRIIDRRPNQKNNPRFYRMIFYLTS